MSLQVWVNGFDITNGVTHFLNYRETEGLFEPVNLVEPGSVDTFDGPYRVRQTTVDYGVRKVKIVGRLNCRSLSYAEKLRALANLQYIYSARPSRVVVGTLELQVDFNNVQVASDEMKRLSTVINYTVEGTAIPATFACVYGSGTGLTQGIPIDTQRINETAVTGTFASGIVSFTCLGDAPTPAVVTIQGAASTTYYLATSVTGRRVPIVCDSLGVGQIDERAGFVLTPGTNRIVAYTASTGTTVATALSGAISLFGTVWRYTGNAAAGSATRMDIGPALTFNRINSNAFAASYTATSSATSWNGSILETSSEDNPRLGNISSTLSNAGLVLEAANQNLFTYSNTFSDASWVSTTGLGSPTANQTGPDGVTNSGSRFTTVTDGGTLVKTISITSGARSYTASIWLKAAITRNISIKIQGNITAAVTTTTSIGTTWVRVSATIITSTDTTLTFTIGGDLYGSTGVAIDMYGAQLELGAFATSYIPTVASAVFRNSDQAGIVSPHNLLLYSEPIQQGTINTTSTPWQVQSNWTVASSSSNSPQNVDNSTLVTMSASGTPGLYQDVIVPGGVAGKTYTFSVWILQGATTTSMAIRIMDQTGTNTRGSAQHVGIDGTWKRFSVTATMAATDTGIRVRIDSYNTAGNILIFGAQLTEGHLPGRYVRTTNTQILPTQMIDPSWSQNGYIEADLRWEYNANTGSVNNVVYIMGDSTTGGTGNFRLDISGGGNNTIRFIRYYGVSSFSNATFTDATLAATTKAARIRIEWVNYVLSGTRYAYLRIYTISGGVATLRTVDSNQASTIGGLWGTIDPSRLFKFRTTAASGNSSDGVIVSNLVIGTPSLPTGAVPAGI